MVDFVQFYVRINNSQVQLNWFDMDFNACNVASSNMPHVGPTGGSHDDFTNPDNNWRLPLEFEKFHNIAIMTSYMK